MVRTRAIGAVVFSGERESEYEQLSALADRACQTSDKKAKSGFAEGVQKGWLCFKHLNRMVEERAGAHPTAITRLRSSSA